MSEWQPLFTSMIYGLVVLLTSRHSYFYNSRCSFESSWELCNTKALEMELPSVHTLPASSLSHVEFLTSPIIIL